MYCTVYTLPAIQPAATCLTSVMQSVRVTRNITNTVYCTHLTSSLSANYCSWRRLHRTGQANTDSFLACRRSSHANVLESSSRVCRRTHGKVLTYRRSFMAAYILNILIHQDKCATAIIFGHLLL
jgi:hypothetical protein